ncbi:MAG: TlpA disulfide reductase family protein [Pirellulaceae bacterium]|nr:TlpA disulfide reductase family protein [Pirellulaceae bacterium]
MSSARTIPVFLGLAFVVLAVSTGCKEQTTGPLTAASSKYEVDEGDEGDSSGGSAASGQPDGADGLREIVGTLNSGGGADGGSGSPSDGGGVGLAPVIRPADTGDSTSGTGVGQTGSSTGQSPSAGAPIGPARPGVAAGGGGGTRPQAGGQSTAGAAQPQREQQLLPPMASYDLPRTNSLEDLLDFVDRLARTRPKGRNEQEMFVDMQHLHRARVQATEAVMANPKANKEQLVRAVNAKLESLDFLFRAVGSRVTQSQVRDHLREFSASLRGHEIEEIAFLGKKLYFDLKAQDLMVKELADGKWVSNEIVALLKIKAEDELRMSDIFNLTTTATQLLYRTGFPEESLKAERAIVGTYKGVENEDLQIALAAFVEQMALVRLDIPDNLESAMSGKKEAIQPLLGGLVKALAREGRGRPTLGMAVRAAQYLEYVHEYDACRTLHDTIEAAFQGGEKDEVEYVKRTIGNARRRMDLIGKPIDLVGQVYAGGDFDIKQLQGKYVLIDFWATWYRPGLELIPHIRRNYERYKEYGFEVVGVNIDEDRNQLKQFFSLQSIPWLTVVGNERGLSSFENPLAKAFGVDALPFALLIDPDGKVVDLHVTGQALSDKLAELFGAAEKKKKEAEEAAKKKQSRIDWNAPHFVSLTENQPADDDEETGDDDKQPARRNPYLASARYSTAQLVEFLLRMREKPQSIQSRDGFAAAVVDAADRVLGDDKASDRFQVIAAEAKFRTLHKLASFGDEDADKQLVAFTKSLADDARPRIAKQVAFFQMERKVIDGAEAPLKDVPALLIEIKAFLDKEKMVEKHLRLASSTVKVLNRIEDAEQRERGFQEFGQLFSKSSDKKLAAYGRKIAKQPKADSAKLVGELMVLEGVTDLGVALDWKSYRGKVVIVDFWATWCGPCLREAPVLKKYYEEQKANGLEVVAVNLDRDDAALAKYLEEHDVAWPNLVADDARAVASKYGVKAIPTFVLVDTKGSIVAVGHKVADLRDKAQALLKDLKNGG